MSSTSNPKSTPIRKVYLGLGSNLKNPPQQLQEGLELISKVFKLDNLKVSSSYKTPPMGGKQQPDYYNLACVFESDKEPQDILALIQEIENQQGRERKEHWGSRTLDIDILMIGDILSDEQDLQIPHPGMVERSFVLGPLLELDSALIYPRDSKPLQHYWDKLPDNDKLSLDKVS